MKGERTPAPIDEKNICSDWIYDSLGEYNGSVSCEYQGLNRVAFYRDCKLWEAEWRFASNLLKLRPATPAISKVDVDKFIEYLNTLVEYDERDDFRLIQDIEIIGKTIIIRFYWEEQQ